jgi:hypothetical protein
MRGRIAIAAITNGLTTIAVDPRACHRLIINSADMRRLRSCRSEAYKRVADDEGTSDEWNGTSPTQLLTIGHFIHVGTITIMSKRTNIKWRQAASEEAMSNAGHVACCFSATCKTHSRHERFEPKRIESITQVITLQIDQKHNRDTRHHPACHNQQPGKQASTPFISFPAKQVTSGNSSR